MTTTTKIEHDTIDEGLDAVDDAAAATRSMAGQVREAVGDAAARVPDAADRARASVEDTTTRLQTLPDDTLRLLAAASVGLAAGLFIAGAPRIATVAALLPAALVGGAIATRSS